MTLTTDPHDPNLDIVEPGGMQKTYLVLSEEERAKGFVRPVRRSYAHIGPPGPRFPLRELTTEEHDRYATEGYVRYEEYPEGISAATGRYWTQAQLEKVGKGCGIITKMGQELAETYARDPHFYGATFCATCRTHLPVGERGEFVWEGTNERVGT